MRRSKSTWSQPIECHLFPVESLWRQSHPTPSPQKGYSQHLWWSLDRLSSTDTSLPTGTGEVLTVHNRNGFTQVSLPVKRPQKKGKRQKYYDNDDDDKITPSDNSENTKHYDYYYDKSVPSENWVTRQTQRYPVPESPDLHESVATRRRVKNWGPGQRSGRTE